MWEVDRKRECHCTDYQSLDREGWLVGRRLLSTVVQAWVASERTCIQELEVPKISNYNYIYTMAIMFMHLCIGRILKMDRTRLERADRPDSGPCINYRPIFDIDWTGVIIHIIIRAVKWCKYIIIVTDSNKWCEWPLLPFSIYSFSAFQRLVRASSFPVITTLVHRLHSTA